MKMKLAGKPATMKMVNYNNGYISFYVPIEWLEEYNENGNLYFYDETSDDEFDLSFSVLTFKPPADLLNPTVENGNEWLQYSK